MTDNIWEELAAWQQHDEDQNLETINRHELQQASEYEAAAQFTHEIKRRKHNEQPN